MKGWLFSLVFDGGDVLPRDGKAPEDWRTPKAGAKFRGPREREASWSAVALYRFPTQRGNTRNVRENARRRTGSDVQVLAAAFISD